jgi:hypothetical protein
MHFTEVFRRYLGWCPDAHARAGTAEIRLDDEAAVTVAGGLFKARAMNWLGLFRNQIILLALYFSVVGVLLSVILGGIDIPMFFIGVLAGSVLSVFQGIRFWKTMNEIREEGAVFLATLYDKTTLALTLVAAMVPTAVFLGAVPGITMTMLNSSIGGFIFILFWWVLLVVWIWESQAKRHLISDGLMLSLARES